MFEKIIKKYPTHHALGGRDKSGGLEQNAWEFNEFCKFLTLNKIKSILEIGMAQGKFKEFMTNELNIKCEGIDIGNNPFVDYVGKSSLKKIINKVGEYDLIFVDGDHSYEAVKADYKNYKSKCKFMAFHDMLGLRDCEGVAKLWAELKKEHTHWEIANENKDIASGIGIIKC